MRSKKRLPEIPGSKRTSRIDEIRYLPPLDFFKKLKNRPYSFFLDSACDKAKLGRYSFMGCDPFLIVKARGRTITLERPGVSAEHVKANPFTLIRNLLKKYATSGSNGLPFIGGAVGYFSYDLKNFIEELPDGTRDDVGIPDCVIGFYDSVIICDNLKDRAYISDLNISKGSSDRLKDAIRSACVSVTSDAPDIACGELRNNFSKRTYLAAVRRAKNYIRNGDIYQVNLSQRFHTRFTGDPFDLYMRLRTFSPAPFASYLDFGDVKIASSSPERFLLKRGDYIETRPIKGTRPRCLDRAADACMEKELRHSAKDMAEHIMIVDLERNDLGRICEYGSVRVDESAIMERYANVFHLVSTVAGKVKAGVGAVDCLEAAFPGGSITGAPKIRSMEIIDELEDVKRSVYTGAIGYLGFDGNMDTSIVIRTFVIKGHDVYFQAGGGIVADSDPEKEYEETLHKISGLLHALGLTRREKGPISV